MAYPSVLPPPVRDGYTATPTIPQKRLLMEDGQYSETRRWNSQPFKMSLTWKLSFKQCEIFEAWLEYDVKQGAGYADIPFAGGTINIRPLSGMPTYRAQGGSWLVTMEVERMLAAPVILPRTGFLPVWPVALPELESEGYQVGLANAVTRSDIEAGGLAQMRVRFQDRLTQYVGTIRVSLEERNAFWDFYNNTLIGGLAPFLAPFANATSQDKLKARFVERPSEMPLNSWFAISLKLETTKAPRMSRADYLALNHGDYINDYVEAGYVTDDYVGYYT